MFLGVLALHKCDLFSSLRTRCFGFFLCMMSAVLVLSFASVPAFAQTSIAVVDIERLLSESKAAQSIDKQLSQTREKFQTEITKHETELRAEEKKLVDSQGKLSQEAFTQNYQAFEKKVHNVRDLVQKRKATLDESYDHGLETLQKAILRIVADLAQENGYQIVLSRQHVVIAEKSLDITEAVMERLDKTLPNVTLTIKP